MPERLCPDCGADISARHPNAKRCEPCSWGHADEARKRMNRERYARSPEVRARKREQNREYMGRPGSRERKRAQDAEWRQSPRGKATRSAYRQRPEVKAANAARMRRRPKPRVPSAGAALDSIMAQSIPSSMHPDLAGRLTKRPRTFAERERAAYAEAMAAAAELRPRECSDCGRETPTAALERNGGLCGFCAEMARRAA